MLKNGVLCVLQRADIDDIPHLADLLRTTFKEYQRRQRGPFLKQVERAAHLARQARPDPEVQLQVPCPGNPIAVCRYGAALPLREGTTS